MGRKSRQKGGMDVAGAGPGVAGPAAGPGAGPVGLPRDKQIIRLLADIKKDSLAPPPIGSDRLNDLFSTMFSGDPYIPDVTTIATGGQDYIKKLDAIEDDINALMEGEEIFQLNVLSHDLVNACASNAIYVFPETGLSPSKAVTDPQFVIRTAAGYLDPGSGSSEITHLYMPKEINFNDEALQRVGFPDGMNWLCQVPTQFALAPPSLVKKDTKPQVPAVTGGPGTDIYTVKIEYPSSGGNVIATGNINMIGSIEPGSVLEQLCKGNAEKNSEINTIGNDNKAIDMLLTKELGDVAQVLVYSHFVSLNKTDLQKQSVMITTDHVVYMLCKEFNLSCIYTGAQKLNGTPRVSGSKHIVTYTGQKLSDKEKLEKIVELHKKTLEKYLLNKKKLITLLLFEHISSPQKNLQFVKIVRGTPKITYAVETHGRDNANYEQIYDHLRTVLDEGINPQIAFVNIIFYEDSTSSLSLDTQQLSLSGDFLDKKKTIDTYFGKLKLGYDETYDLLTYNKITKQFTATEKFNEKIPGIISIRPAVGGGDYNSGKKNSQSGGSSFRNYIVRGEGAPEMELINDISSPDTDKLSEYFTPLLRDFHIYVHTYESIMHTDQHITLESAFLIHLIYYKLPGVDKNRFSVLYDYFKRQINDDFFNYIHSFIFDGRTGIDSESLVNFIIYNGQVIANDMGLYTQDFFHIEEAKRLAEAAAAEPAAAAAARLDAASATEAVAAEAARLAEESMVIARAAAEAKRLAAERAAAERAAEAARLEAERQAAERAAAERAAEAAAAERQREEEEAAAAAAERAAAEARRRAEFVQPTGKRRRDTENHYAFPLVRENTPTPLVPGERPRPLKIQRVGAGGARKTKRKQRRNRKDKKKKKTQTRNRNNSRAKSSKKRTVKVSRRKSKTQQPKDSE